MLHVLLSATLLLVTVPAPAPASPAPPSSVQADADALERARRLREEATADWREKRHAAAIEKLRTADAIYVEQPGEFLADRAVVLRAIVWNQVRAGEVAAALETLGDLAALVARVPEHAGQVRIAYTALHEAAAGLERWKDCRALIEDCRAVLERHGYGLLVAQTLHDEASFAGDREDWKAMAALFRRAIRERDRLGDRVGATWSRNNLAYHQLRAGDLEAALPPLADAHRAVLDGVLEPESSVAINLGTALARIAADEPDRDSVTWLWEVGRRAAASPRPAVFPADRLLRAALAAEIARKGDRGAPAAAKKLVAVDLHGRPAEVRADLLLHAADAALAGGKPRAALGWLEGLDCGAGPCTPHLEARCSTLVAIAHAAEGHGADFDEAARAAAEAWRALGERAGREESLRRLSEAAQACRAPSEPALTAEYEELRRTGRPGGFGGSASSRGADPEFDELGPHDPVFAVRWVEGAVRVTDLLGETSRTDDLAWAQRPVGLNGLSLGLFGGYVTVRALNYGPSAAAGGGQSAVALAELGSYYPLPADGALLVTKNGAVRYALDR